MAAGLTQPGMWITRDAASMRLERLRAGGWPEAEITAQHATMRAAFEGGAAAAYFVQLPGAFHSTFMDVPNWSPLASWLGVAGPIDGRRAHDNINAYSLRGDSAMSMCLRWRFLRTSAVTRRFFFGSQHSHAGRASGASARHTTGPLKLSRSRLNTGLPPPLPLPVRRSSRSSNCPM